MDMNHLTILPFFVARSHYLKNKNEITKIQSLQTIQSSEAVERHIYYNISE